MYFKYVHFEGLKRMQGAHMDWIEDIPRELNRLKGKYRQPDRIYEKIEAPLIQGVDGADIIQFMASENANTDDDILLEVVKWLIDTEASKLSNVMLKRQFSWGYDRAEVFMDMLEQHEIVDAKRGKLARNVSQEKATMYLEKYTGLYCRTSQSL